MLKRMPYRDLLWWRSYERVEPFGELRDDYRAASIAAATVNAALILRGARGRVAVADFLLEFTEATEAPTKKGESPKPPAAPVANWQQMKMAAKMHFAVSKATKQKRQKGRKPR